MATSVENNAATKSESFSAEVSDFNRSLFHSAIESPVNAVVQLVDQTTNAHLPELHLVDAPTNNSVGTIAGSIVGTAADMIALSAAGAAVLGGVGGAGIAGLAIRGAIIGATYGGIFQSAEPTTDNTNFAEQRLQNAAIGATTFAAMGGVSGFLTKTGLFAAGTIAAGTESGAITGASGGVVDAEGTALLKQDRLFPTAKDLLADTAQYTVFGAAYGALGAGWNNLVAPANTDVASAPKNADSTVAQNNSDPSKASDWSMDAYNESMRKWAALPQNHPFPESDVDIKPLDGSVIKNDINLVGRYDGFGDDNFQTYKSFLGVQLSPTQKFQPSEALKNGSFGDMFPLGDNDAKIDVPGSEPNGLDNSKGYIEAQQVQKLAGSGPSRGGIEAEGSTVHSVAAPGDWLVKTTGRLGIQRIVPRTIFNAAFVPTEEPATATN